MNEKKLTDAEIIKALECCGQNVLFEHCVDCPFDDLSKAICTIRLSRVVLDLINRQQAENERLKRKIEDLESVQEISPEAKYLVDTKADKVISLLNEVIKSQEQIKAKAYKECLEKIEQRDVSESKFYIMVKKTEFDNLLKEKVGEDK